MPGLETYASVELDLGRASRRGRTQAHRQSRYRGRDPRGLLVPNVKGAESLSLDELAQAINSIVAIAREGKTQPADMAGGNFTITNIGVFGIDAGTPILNPGESGILCIGQIARRPWVVGAGEEERIEPRWVATLTVSFDHRLADGQQGSVFLADVAEVLTDPGLALLY